MLPYQIQVTMVQWKIIILLVVCFDSGPATDIVGHIAIPHPTYSLFKYLFLNSYLWQRQLRLRMHDWWSHIDLWKRQFEAELYLGNCIKLQQMEHLRTYDQKSFITRFLGKREIIAFEKLLRNTPDTWDIFFGCHKWHPCYRVSLKKGNIAIFA